MADYALAKTGKLKLKGEKEKSKKKKRKHKTQDDDVAAKERQLDILKHGGWKAVDTFIEMTGSVAIEFGNSAYVKALDNGLFTLGAPHDDGDGPSPEEVLTAIKVSETKIALKSGYGKYVGIDKNGVVTGRADAVGSMEQWEPIFQDGKLALLSANGCFVALTDDDSLEANSKVAGPSEIIKIRVQLNDAEESSAAKAARLNEDEGDVSQVELNYVKKFQKFQDKKIKLFSGEKIDLVKAKDEGVFHETMLDRRSKMKADRYCK
ncbi:protein FRG1 [Neocloeon triangulifer]|uniref:protein FRG1 n=1 Tax=Neocloeon triangulifer TaxID=2078957 RepID=UPI00286EF47D|nr:protein FRG1 [Neocloeon triangulifer]